MTDTKGGNRYNYLIVFIVALGSFTYGFNNSIIGSVFGLPGFWSYFGVSGASGDPASDSILGAANGTFYGGAMIGCLINAWLCDRIGRIRCMQIVCILVLIGSILQAAAVNVAMFMIGRTVTGLASGMINCTIPLYQSEISPPKSRGKMVGHHGVLLVSGYAMAGWSGYGCYFEPNPQIAWRLLLSLQVITPSMLLACSPWLPESPRWLISRDRHEEAATILKRLHSGMSDNLGRDLAHDEFLQIQQQLQLEKAQPTSLMAMFKNPSYRWRMLAGSSVQFFAQCTGVLVINNYQVLLYNSLGLFGSKPLLLYSLYLTWAAFQNWVSAMIVDRVGRVLMLTIGITGCGCMVICFTAMVATFSGTDNKVGNGFGVFFLFAFVGFYGGCVDAVSWIYCSEVFPMHARARGFAFSVATFLGTALVFTQSAPIAFTNIGWKFYIVFIIISFIGAPVLYFKCPETKGLSLEEIAAIFGDEVAPDLEKINEKEGVQVTELENADNKSD